MGIFKRSVLTIFKHIPAAPSLFPTHSFTNQKAKEFHDAWELWVPWMPYSATIHRILIHTAEMMRLLPETLTLAHFSEVISVTSVLEFEIAELSDSL